MDEEWLEQIQIKIAYLERANNDLSDVVFRQQQEIQALNLRIDRVTERLESAQPEDGVRTPDEERPPHY